MHVVSFAIVRVIVCGRILIAWIVRCTLLPVEHPSMVRQWRKTLIDSPSCVAIPQSQKGEDNDQYSQEYRPSHNLASSSPPEWHIIIKLIIRVIKILPGENARHSVWLVV